MKPMPTTRFLCRGAALPHRVPVEVVEDRDLVQVVARDHVQNHSKAEDEGGHHADHDPLVAAERGGRVGREQHAEEDEPEPWASALTRTRSRRPSRPDRRSWATWRSGTAS